MLLTFTIRGVTVTLKKYFCLYHYSNEAGGAALQIGPIVLEWSTRSNHESS